MPPEIQFERAVFDGAPYVRFFYKIQVRQERQLNAHNAIVERLTMLTSDVLTYNLDRNKLKTATPPTKGKSLLNFKSFGMHENLFEKSEFQSIKPRLQKVCRPAVADRRPQHLQSAKWISRSVRNKKRKEKKAVSAEHVWW